MENEELTGDQTSQGETRLNQEISREEGTGSWDEFEIEPEDNVDGEIEAGQDAPEEITPVEIEVIVPDDTEEINQFPALDMIDEIPTDDDSSNDEDEPLENGAESTDDEEEETEQKNTLSDKSPRVLSFKDFFSNN